MIALTTRYLALGEQALADSMRLSSICLDCATRLSTIQVEAAGALFMRQALAFPLWARDDTLAAITAGYRTTQLDEWMYSVGEANRVLVDSQSQLRMVLEERLGDAAESARAPALTGKRRAGQRAPRGSTRR